MITRKLIFAFALLVAVPRVAWAQDQDKPPPDESTDKSPDESPPPKPAPEAPTAEDLEKAKAAYIEGKRLIEDEHDIQGGVAKFKQSYRLSRNPLLLYNIGFALDSLKDQEGALIYYKKFLSDTADGAPNRDLAAERVKVLNRQADADAMFSGTAAAGSEATGTETTGTETTGKTAPPPAPAKHKTVTEFEHRVVEEAPPGKPLDLSAFVPESAHWQLTLYYRTAGRSKFSSTPMRPRYNELVGRIPASAMHGNTIQYYIEARDPQGKVIGRSGHATSPNLVFIDPSAKPQFYPDIEGGDTVEAGADNDAGGAMLGNSGNPTGPSDQPRNLETYTRWGTTAGAGAFLTMAVTFYFIASDANSGLEGEAFSSNNENCPMGPPCRSFSDAQKTLQSRGQTFETLTNVMLISGVVTAGAAGYLWYREYERNKEHARTSGHRVVVTPAVGPGFIGGAAALRF